MSIKSFIDRTRYFDRRFLLKNLTMLFITLVAVVVIVLNTPIMEKIKIRRQVKTLVESAKKEPGASNLSIALSARKIAGLFTQDGNVELQHDDWQDVYPATRFAQRLPMFMSKAEKININYHDVKIRVVRDYLARVIFSAEVDALGVDGKKYQAEAEVFCLFYRIDRQWLLKSLVVRNKPVISEKDDFFIEWEEGADYEE